MNLQPVNPPYPSVVLVCCECGQRGKSEDMLADLDGEPFSAYYHKRCPLGRPLTGGATNLWRCGSAAAF